MSFFSSSECQRCGTTGEAFTMSRFNQDRICIPCQGIEIKHPDYQKAVDAELKALQQGIRNYEGIGKPADL